MRLFEIEVSQSIHEPSINNVKAMLASPIVDTYRGKDIGFMKQDVFEIYFIRSGDEILSYLMTYWNEYFSTWGAKQAWTKLNARRQQLSEILFEYAILIAGKKPMISDFQMALPAIHRTEKMRERGNIKYSVLRTSDKTIHPYDPSIPIYDEPIISSTMATPETKYDYIWIMEEDELSKYGIPKSSSSLLQEHVRFLKN